MTIKGHPILSLLATRSKLPLTLPFAPVGDVNDPDSFALNLVINLDDPARSVHSRRLIGSSRDEGGRTWLCAQSVPVL
jgi:hypothetical protein